MEKFWGGDYVFLQDWTRVHTAKKSIAYLDEHWTEYVKPEFSPPNSPNMKALDFVIRGGNSETEVWQNNLSDIKSFQDAIPKEWETYPQVNIDNTINSFKKRLQNMIKADSGYIERYKW